MTWPDGLPAVVSHVKYVCRMVGRVEFENKSVSLIHQYGLVPANILNKVYAQVISFVPG